MKVYCRDRHLFVLDNIKRISVTSEHNGFELCLYYNDDTVHKQYFVGDYRQMDDTLHSIARIMGER